MSVAYDSERGVQSYAVPYESHLVMTASPDLERAVGSLMKDPARILGERGLTLASRPMRFENHRVFQQFKASAVDPLIAHAGSELHRVRLRPFAKWETTQTPRGELNRIYFPPQPAEAVALRGLYEAYVKNNWTGARPYNVNDARERMRSSSLTYTIPTQFLDIHPSEAEQFLTETMMTHPHGANVFYAADPEVCDRAVG